MEKGLYLLICFALCCCATSTEQSKWQYYRNNIAIVSDKIKEIDTKDIFVHAINYMQIVSDYLLIQDIQAKDSIIHIYNKNDFTYITSFGRVGQGPRELARPAPIIANRFSNSIVMIDNGRNTVCNYPIDSMLSNYMCLPSFTRRISEIQTPLRYGFINDHIAIGTIATPSQNGEPYKQTLVKWDIISGDIQPLSYTNPKVKIKRTYVGVSAKDSIVVEAYALQDLFTIYDLNGHLICNVFGPQWHEQGQGYITYFKEIAIGNHKIFLPSTNGSNKRTQIHVFNLEGDYLKTLETGMRVDMLCFDDDNNRLILGFNDVIQFAYLDLDGILD